MIYNSMDWSIIEITSSGLEINFDEWENRLLLNKYGFQEDQAKKLISLLKDWLPKVQTADFRILRWLCHGHIGFTFIVEVYSRCLFEVCSDLPDNKRTNTTNSFRGKKNKQNTLFNICAQAWSRISKDNQIEYPQEVLELLNLN